LTSAPARDSWMTTGPVNEGVIERLDRAKVSYRFVKEGKTWWTLITAAMPLALLFVFVIVLGIMIRLNMRTIRFGKVSRRKDFGTTPATRLTPEAPTTASRSQTFDDVIGADDAKEALDEVVAFLRSPEIFRDLKCRIRRGVLLTGLPG